jgi:hypothetical protein
MAIRIHRLLIVIPFNANGISRQRHVFSKQLQDQKIDMALNISNLMRGSVFQITTFIEQGLPG